MPEQAVIEVRKFADANVQAAVDRALAAVPAGKSGAVVAYANLQGASLAVMARIGDHWSVVAAAYKPFGGALAAEAETRWTW